MRHLLILIFLITGAACADDDAPAQRSELDAAPDFIVADQAADAERLDAEADIEDSPDLVVDQERDAAPEDMTPDVAPDMCECSSGPCCDGCMFRSVDVVCSDRWRKVTCTAGVTGQVIHYDQYCSGASSACDGSRKENRTREIDCSPGRCFPGEGDRWPACAES